MPKNQQLTEEPTFSPFNIWEKGRVTQHLGGITATQALLADFEFSPDTCVLEIGGGTGFTISELNKTTHSHLYCLDLLFANLIAARNRNKAPIKTLYLMQADAHSLPFADKSFNLVIIESVLVFCQAAYVLSEIHRVLASGGKIAFNEFTYLKTPPQKLVSLVESKIGLHPFDQNGWEELLINCGFQQVRSSIHKIDFMTQLRNHLKVDGIKNYFGAIIAGISDTSIRRTFFTREMLSAARLFLPYIGYGLYTGFKQ
ncbi:MAG: hypothetical protein C0410_08365 [Anaerolinea sp.]|nr:hypothetical protein [Anaerolinea sp.]